MRVRNLLQVLIMVARTYFALLNDYHCYYCYHLSKRSLERGTSNDDFMQAL